MVKVLFVCLGNICRSPMAEFVFKDMVNKKGLSDKFIIESAGTSNFNAIRKAGIYIGTKKELDKNNIPYTKRYAKHLKKTDYDKYDYILAMEEKNIKNILNIIGEDKENKVHRLLDFTKKPRDIIDPWYYNNFDETYIDIVEGCNCFLEHLTNTILNQK